MVNDILIEYGRQVRDLQQENETLRLELMKQRVLNKARTDRITEAEKTIADLVDQLRLASGDKTSLQEEVSQCLALIDRLSCENRELKIENASVTSLSEECNHQRTLAIRFEHMYNEILDNKAAVPLGGAMFATYDFPRPKAFNSESKTIQTESLLTLSKYCQVDSYDAARYMVIRE